MSKKDLNVALVIIASIGVIGFLAITADVMTKHPTIPWFGCGVLATLVVEALIYGIYRLIKHIREGK